MKWENSGTVVLSPQQMHFRITCNFPHHQTNQIHVVFPLWALHHPRLHRAGNDTAVWGLLGEVVVGEGVGSLVGVLEGALVGALVGIVEHIPVGP